LRTRGIVRSHRPRRPGPVRQRGSQRDAAVTVQAYLRSTHPLVITVDIVWAGLLAAAPTAAILALRWFVTTAPFDAPLHRLLWTDPAYRLDLAVYAGFIGLAAVTNAAWAARALRNFIAITLVRRGRTSGTGSAGAPTGSADLPPHPYDRESFAL